MFTGGEDKVLGLIPFWSYFIIQQLCHTLASSLPKVIYINHIQKIVLGHRLTFCSCFNITCHSPLAREEGNNTVPDLSYNGDFLSHNHFSIGSKLDKSLVLGTVSVLTKLLLSFTGPSLTSKQILELSATGLMIPHIVIEIRIFQSGCEVVPLDDVGWMALLVTVFYEAGKSGSCCYTSLG